MLFKCTASDSGHKATDNFSPVEGEERTGPVDGWEKDG